ncbi:MAG: indole-3-glycerol phosphate synthase TrpC [Firmicutes bacterium HGW-Firmicutes-1]|jgi:indole-3-glycerol phosphate synthase|nr:MAG: indole-3-glycerol phosphate synthase TrpC [Firmicutes bacterium HGW-Firmicutes-1]
MADRIYLKDIVNSKQIRNEKQVFHIEDMMKQIEALDNRPSFRDALAKNGLSIIGEIKKASPSKGIIREDFNPIEIAKVYETAVDAISVLTEEDYFLGRDVYLKEISELVKLPTLCKDFILIPEQIYKAKLLGASAVLLIVAILTNEQLKEYIDVAKSVGMDALVEIHTKQELERALQVGATIMGINNRNLESFKTDLNVTLELRPFIPEGIIVVSESGIHTTQDIKQLTEANIDAILVGESFMRTDDIGQHAKELKYAYKG